MTPQRKRNKKSMNVGNRSHAKVLCHKKELGKEICQKSLHGEKIKYTYTYIQIDREMDKRVDVHRSKNVTSTLIK